MKKPYESPIVRVLGLNKLNIITASLGDDETRPDYEEDPFGMK